MNEGAVLEKNGRGDELQSSGVSKDMCSKMVWTYNKKLLLFSPVLLAAGMYIEDPPPG